jgi:TPR repeat protein
MRMTPRPSLPADFVLVGRQLMRQVGVGEQELFGEREIVAGLPFVVGDEVAVVAGRAFPGDEAIVGREHQFGDGRMVDALEAGARSWPDPSGHNFPNSRAFDDGQTVAGHPPRHHQAQRRLHAGRRGIIIGEREFAGAALFAMPIRMMGGVLAAVLASSAAAGTFDEGVAAYHKGDYATSLRLWRPLAEQGDASAQFNLGLLYDDGNGVPQDYAEAAKWYRLAAEQGLVNAEENLGVLYDLGRGVPKDFAQAAKWWRKAAEQGDAKAQVRLGDRYGRETCRVMAEIAASTKESIHQCLIEQGVPQDYAEAVKWYRMAAEQGDAAGQVMLGLMYDLGRGVPLSPVEAVKWYSMAADQGDIAGQANLGLSYLNGTGVPKDYVLAYMWFDLAAAREGYSDSADAQNRDDVAKLMTPDQIAEAQRLAREWKPRP